jgi:urea transport system ATP-binding protein
VLLLDEPTEGIQPNVIQHIGQVLTRLVAERGLTIVMVEQYLDFVKEIGDRFYVLDRRRVVAEGLTVDLSTDLVHRHLSV